MFPVANGSPLRVGLVSGDGPPLSPETVGRSPSFLEAPPVPLKPLSELLPKPPVALQASDAPPAPAPDEAPVEAEELPPAAAQRRLVVRLLGGEEVELGSYDDRESAVIAAQTLIAQFAAAETAGDWPEVEGRFLRPASVASIDVLVQG